MIKLPEDGSRKILRKVANDKSARRHIHEDFNLHDHKPARKTRGSQTHEIDYLVAPKNRPHPADGAINIEVDGTKDSTVLAYTDGSKSELGVGSGTVIFIGNKIVTQIKSRLDVSARIIKRSRLP